MQANYIADALMQLSKLLKSYDDPELQLAAMTLTNIGAEVRKSHRLNGVAVAASGLKPAPRRIDPNSMVPRPTTPPKGSGPVKLAMN
jgi:hypothetical protein